MLRTTANPAIIAAGTALETAVVTTRTAFVATVITTRTTLETTVIATRTALVATIVTTRTSLETTIVTTRTALVAPAGAGFSVSTAPGTRPATAALYIRSTRLGLAAAAGSARAALAAGLPPVALRVT